MRFRTVTGVLLLVGLVAASCSIGLGDSPSRSSCAGIGAEFGGCDDDLPQFTATDCATVGREFGAFLDQRTVDVITGPEAVDGEARSVRIMQTLVLLSASVNQYLREAGLHADCDVPVFLEAAETEFSPELKDSVGGALFDGNPAATYEDWYRELTRTIGVIDAEE